MQTLCKNETWFALGINTYTSAKKKWDKNKKKKKKMKEVQLRVLEFIHKL